MGIILTQLFEVFVKVAGFNFTALKIAKAETLLAAHPPLGAAIAKLTRLGNLELSFAGERCAELLRTLQSKLVMATFSFGDVDGEQDDEDIPEGDRNPILLLHGSQATLQCLDTSFSVSSLNGPRYPNMVDLTLSYMDLPMIEDYIRAFPNLRALSAVDCSGPYGIGTEVWEERRMSSIGYQARHGTWQSLQYYCGSVLILWIFGLACRIHSVELDFEDDELDLAKFDDVLRAVRPTCLALRLPEASCIMDEDFRSALCRCKDSLKVVDLHVSFNSRKDATLFVGDILDSLADVIRTSSATSLALCLDWSWAAGERMDSSEELPPMPFEVYLQEMNVDGYADTLLASVASLQELHVSLVGPRRCSREAERKRTRDDSRNASGGSSGNAEDWT
ncbi:hypothetical protein GSI_15597 [Ganoderma sinense ZZ0214-1]|uniref:F-box domain-containing protein n=1 Tax=Ganoderma sinense ZZ0214-1 TaxID=1077348 RepID=A0A2G8RN24_9APHY|nr:hypothetical protein GSI_15597 [Ganoderma sinense ZZ0214-1]